MGKIKKLTINQLVKDDYNFRGWSDLPFNKKLTDMLAGYHQHHPEDGRIIYDEKHVLMMLIQLKNNNRIKK